MPPEVSGLGEDLAPLLAVLADLGPAAIAVSGGVDSMTLASIAHRFGCHQYTMCHAVSPAVPAHATERVLRYMAHEGWRLRLIDAGEMRDADYVRNPLNRCYFCKSNLYRTIAESGVGAILSGTNIDDLSDWRPGLQAARDVGVHHPFVETQCTKQDVRRFARMLGHGDLSELPASPCLSSRIETNLPISAAQLRMVDRVEQAVARRLSAQNIRCRVRADAIVLEIDQSMLKALDNGTLGQLRDDVVRVMVAAGERRPLRILPYRRGSAFLGAPHAGTPA